MATLTGERIKDTYDGLLKLEDSQAITSSSKVVTDGLGNTSALSVSTIGIDVSGDAQVTGELESTEFIKTGGLSTEFLMADGSVSTSSSGGFGQWDDVTGGINYASGNVGIGTTSPAYPLQVSGTISSDSIYINNTQDGHQIGKLIIDYTSSNRPGLKSQGGGGVFLYDDLILRFNNNNIIASANHSSDLFFKHERTGDNGFRFQTLDSGDVMRINGAGNVGIGTTSPSQKLEVDGEVLSDGYRLSAMQSAPSGKGDTGTLGEIRITQDYIYVCYATNSWSRVALETSW